MKFFKILILMLAAMVCLTAASAYVDAKMDVYPAKGIDKGEDFLIFGYIDADDELSEDDLQIRIYDDDGDLYKKYTPHFEGKDGSDSDDEGYFYKKLSISSEGEYRIKLRVDGTNEESEKVEIEDIGSKEVKIDDFSYSISGSTIKFSMDVENKEDEDREISVYLKGEDNWNSPKKIEVDVDADDEDHITKSYSLSTFGDGRFIVAAYARSDSGHDESYSSPAYLLIDDGDVDYDYTYDYDYDFVSYGYGNLDITDIEIEDLVFYPGDVIEGYVTIRNYGGHESQYRFEYIVDNQVFKKGDVGYVEPGYTATETVAFEVPDVDSFKMTAKVYSGGYTDVGEKTFLVSHKLKYFSPYLSDSSKEVDAGQNDTIVLTIRNKGNEDDTYKIDFDGWDFYAMQNTLSVDAGEEDQVEIEFEVPENSYVGTYPVVIEICNTEDVCRAKNFELLVNKPEAEQTVITWDENQTSQYFEENETLSYAITIKNIELEEKDYTVSVDLDGAEVEISDESFELENEETKEVTIEITPDANESINATIEVNAEGEEIFTKDVEMVYTEDKEAAIGGITGFAVYQGGAVKAALYILAAFGAGTLVLIGYKAIQSRVLLEKIMSYQRAKNMRADQEQRKIPQATQDNYFRQPAQPQRTPQTRQLFHQQQLTPRQPVQYHPDSFMRKF